MKVIVETSDDDLFIEVVLAGYDLDAIDMGKILAKEIRLGRKKASLSVRGETQREKYASDEE